MLDGVTDDVLHLDVYLAELVQQLGAWANAATFATIFAETGLGDVCTHGIGRFIDRRLLSGPRRYLRPEHGERAHEFYERHGGMAIVRTLAPCVAGVARLEIHRLVFYAAVASALWVTIFRGAGSWFGTAEWVQDYLAIALAVIVIASALPGPVVWAVIVRAGAQTSRGEARTPSVARAGAGGPSRHRCRGHSLHRASSP